MVESKTIMCADLIKTMIITFQVEFWSILSEWNRSFWGESFIIINVYQYEISDDSKEKKSKNSHEMCSFIFDEKKSIQCQVKYNTFSTYFISICLLV